MSDEWWRSLRRKRVDEAAKTLLGVDPRTKVGEDALQAQRFQVGAFVRQCYDGDYDPITLIQSLMVGAIFIADNHGVSREQLAKLVHAVELKVERQLIFRPGE